MTEAELLNTIMRELSRHRDVRIWRNHVGMGWMGRILSHHGDRVLLTDARRCAIGLAPGTSDLIGWHSIIIQPHHVGQRFARFVAIEAKTPRGTLSDKQAAFLRIATAHGAAAAVVRNVADATDLLEGLS